MDAELPELPAARRERYQKTFNLDDEAAYYLTSEAFFGDFFEQAVVKGAEGSEVAKWMANTVSRLSNETEVPLQESKLTPAGLGELLKLVQEDEVGAKSAQKVLEVLYTEGGEAGSVVDKLGLRQMSSTDDLRPMLERILSENPAVVQQFKDGKGKALNVLVGKVMKETKGAANPALTRKLFEEMIGATV